METIEDYKYLWDGSAAWVLVRLKENAPGEKPRYVISNTETKRVLLISDNELYAAVKEMMIAKGVRIVPVGEN